MSNVDRDQLATELYSDIIANYPNTGYEVHFIYDTRYIISILLRHLRCTPLDEKTLLRNKEFFKAYIKNVKYTTRTQWLKGMETALAFFFPVPGLV